MNAVPLTLAGHEIPDSLDLVRRYAGLPWSGGEPETWAWPFYDEVPSELDDVVTVVDVLAASVLHPGLSRAELTFFVDRAGALAEWLRAVDPEEMLWFASDDVLMHLDRLGELAAEGVPLSLITKVLHRKRPDLVPLLDRHVIDRYRPVTGEHRGELAWPHVVRAIRADLEAPEDRLVLSVAAAEVRNEVTERRQLASKPWCSLLRYLDIAAWMDARTNEVGGRP